MERSQNYSAVLLAAVLLPGLLQITECRGGRSGNTLLSSLELEAGQQDRVAGFVSAQRDYDVWVPGGMDTVILRAESVDPGSTIALSYLGTTEPIGTGAGELSVDVAPGQSALVVLVTAPGGAVRSYVLNATHDDNPAACHGGAPKSELVTVACRVSSIPDGDPWVLPYELTIDPGPILADHSFTAEVGGTAVMSDYMLDLFQSPAFDDGTTQFELADFAATVQVRSGATGPDVELRVDVSALTPGLTRFCQLPYGQVCADDSECLVPPCLPPVTLVDIPTSADCAPGGICDALGKANGPDSQCARNGFCATGPLLLPLLSQSVAYRADSSASEVLWGWADQDVPGLVICPDPSEPGCASNGGTVPDGAYALPEGVLVDPAGPIGTRTFVDNAFFFAEQCAMATQSEDGGGAPIPNVFEPTPDTDLLSCTVHPPACFLNSDCPSGHNCVNHAPTSCSSGGVCEPVPGSCDTIVNEVCGCDGVTYSNYCGALVAGVRASASGPCECAANSDCAPTDYCNAITCDGPGTCTPMPSTCSSGPGNILACNGLTYDSICEAAAAGARVGGELYPPTPF